jgi:hypothetical protein
MSVSRRCVRGPRGAERGEGGCITKVKERQSQHKSSKTRFLSSRPTDQLSEWAAWTAHAMHTAHSAISMAEKRNALDATTSAHAERGATTCLPSLRPTPLVLTDNTLLTRKKHVKEEHGLEVHPKQKHHAGERSERGEARVQGVRTVERGGSCRSDPKQRPKWPTFGGECVCYIPRESKKGGVLLAGPLRCPFVATSASVAAAPVSALQTHLVSSSTCAERRCWCRHTR